MQNSDVEGCLEIALELGELAESMLREKLRRTNPALTATEVEARIDAWFMQRPGAERGDAEGREVRWPRSRA